jgi:hypothetical protein
MSVSEIYFLHIGKCAGSKIKALSGRLPASEIVIKALPHKVKLRQLSPHLRYFFSIRDPLTRFKSGFYSRKRKGRPTYNSEWTPFEAAAFSKFEDANDLAENLFRSDNRGRSAMDAIQSIEHTSMQQIDWFEGTGVFSVRPPIWIVRQENFADDFQELMRRCGIHPIPRTLSEGLVERVHANEYPHVSEFTDLATSNLRKWYARDFAFYEQCTEWMKEQLDRKFIEG